MSVRERRARTDPRPEVEVEVEGSGAGRPRRRRRWPYVVGGIVLALALAAAATTSPALDVDEVVVEGTSRTPAQAVLERAGLRTGEAMVAVDTGRAATRVEALPWVRSATVRRSWPGRVVIAVRERVPVAAFAGSGRWLLVDGEGRRLARVRRPVPDAVPVEGVGSRGRPGTRVDGKEAGAVELSRLLPPAVRFRLPRVRVDAEGRLEVTLQVDEADADVVFGRPEQLRDKVVALVTVLESVDLRDVAHIDLRIPGAPVLTRA